MRSCDLTKMFAAAVLVSIAIAQQSQAASDCDVYITKVKSVDIQPDKITIVGEASIGMVIITPELPENGKSLRYTGRLSTRIRIKADQATFTVLRPGGRPDPWEEMSMQAAKDLKAGKPIGRIGYYRPDITIKENCVHAISGKGYIYHKRTDTPADATPSDK